MKEGRNIKKHNKKKMKNSNKIILLFFIIPSLLIACQSQQDVENFENCMKLKVGMTKEEVIYLMGDPLHSEYKYSQTFQDSVIFYTFKYDNPLASGGIEVYIHSKSDSLIRAFCDEEVIKD